MNNAVVQEKKALIKFEICYLTYNFILLKYIKNCEPGVGGEVSNVATVFSYCTAEWMQC